MSAFRFSDRAAAGQLLARLLAPYANRKDVVVLALPRGGLPVAFEIACALHAPLDVFLVRKLGVPRHQELAMGAIASGGTCVLNESVVRLMNVSAPEIEAVTAAEQCELARREHAFRSSRPVEVSHRICILVDDGLATGSTMRAAVMALGSQNPKRLIVAVPVAPADCLAQFESLADELICPYNPEPFGAVGRWYDDFSQLSDDDVRGYLNRAGCQMAH